MLTKIWEKDNWALKKETKSKQYLLSYRNRTKLIFPEEFIDVYEIAFLPTETGVQITSMGQNIIRVLR